MKLTLIISGLATACISLTPTTLPTPTTYPTGEISQENLLHHIEKLTHPEMQGRQSESVGSEKAADYIATQMKEAGLSPGGVNGTYFQLFDAIIKPPTFEPETRLVDNDGTILQPKRDFLPWFLSSDGEATAPVVFAGYGASDDLRRINVNGKFVLILLNSPTLKQENHTFLSNIDDISDELMEKTWTAKLSGAKGVIFTTLYQEKENSIKDIIYSDIPYIQSKTNNNMVIYINSEIALKWIIEQSTNTINMTPRQIKNNFTINIKRKQSIVKFKNIIGIIEPKNMKKYEKIDIIIGAHYDSIGIKDGNLYPGADDNASGIAALIETARYISLSKEKPKARIVFCAFSGEENFGYLENNEKIYYQMLGSSSYLIQNKQYKISNMINLHMIGRMSDNTLYLTGKEPQPYFDNIVKKANTSINITTKTTEDLYITKNDVGMASAHNSFIEQQIPAIQLSTGVHNDTHTPLDTPDKLNLDGLYKITKFTINLLYLLSSPDSSSLPSSSMTAQLAP